MSRPRMTQKIGLLASLAVLLVGFLACSVDTPTAPDQVPAPPPTQGGDNWNISVSVSPNEIVVGSDVPATVKVDVESRFDGSSPINGTLMRLSTTLGEFNAMDSEETTVGVVIDRGKASALLFAGEVAAGGTVYARLEGSTGRRGFAVLGELQAPFITSVSPESGAESGGTSVTIEGTNFGDINRVTFTTNSVVKLATINSASDTSIRVTTPPAGKMSEETCDFNGEDGARTVPTPSTVSVEYLTPSGETLVGSIDGAFTYNPASNACRDVS